MICFLFFDFFSLSVHGIVNHGVDTAVGHGQPVEGQEHVGGVPGLHDGGVEEGVHEVDMVWEPANRKYSSHCTKHLHNLNRSIVNTFYVFYPDLLFILPVLDQAGRVLPNDRLPPQLPAHLCVADGHHQEGDDVGQDEEDHVVAEKDRLLITL